MNVNLRGTFVTMRELVPLMGGRRASIVNTSSGLGLVGTEQFTAYCASKGGVVMLSKAAALELGPEHPRQRDLPRRDRHADAAAVVGGASR